MYIISNLKKLIQSSRGLLVLGGILLAAITLAGVMAVTLYVHYQDRIFPDITIGPVAVGGLTKAEAVAKLETALTDYRSRWPISLEVDHHSVKIDLPEAAVTYHPDTSVEAAFNSTRPASLSSMVRLLNPKRSPLTLPVSVQVEDDWLNGIAATIAGTVEEPVIQPHLELVNSFGAKKMVAVPGQAGYAFDAATWKSAMQTSLHQLTNPPTSWEVTATPMTVSETQLRDAESRANVLLQTELTLSANETSPQTWKLTGSDLVKFVLISGGYDVNRIEEYLKGVASVVNQAPKDARFQFDETSLRVTEFGPAEDGIELLIPETTQSLVVTLDRLAQKQPVDSVVLATKRTPPAMTLEAANTLGIKERLGVGSSTYKGSIASRVHNVELAANRINGTLIKPGEEFSFNAAVGDISQATGYEQAYVIRNGRTELGDGGGVCQDSTTVFRAALNAGLPITVRRGHAYRVGYYEQDTKPGLDATVFSPSTDLKFLNDTPGYILLQTVVDSPNRSLKVYLYGTSDGRKAAISDQTLWDVTPPPPDVYVDDPTLTMGQTKQIDWKAAGAKAKFTYTVERSGETIFQKTFVTTYQPWAAVFLRGTKP